MKKILFIVLAWLVIVNIFALLSLNRYNLQEDIAYAWIVPSEFSKIQDWSFVSLHNRWDSFWYLDIA